MLNIHHIMCNMFQENCYVVSDETKECVIIDCGAFFEKDKSALTQYIADNQLTPRRLLATHGHVDHNLGNAFVFATYGLRPEMHEDDSELLEHLPEQAAYLLNMQLEEKQPPVGRTIGSPSFIHLATLRVVVCSIARPKAWPLQAIRFSEGRLAELTCLAEACLK